MGAQIDAPYPRKLKKRYDNLLTMVQECHFSISLRPPARLRRRQRQLYIRPADIRHRLPSTQQLTGKMLNYSLPFPLLKSSQQELLQIYINEQGHTHNVDVRLA